MHGWGNIYKKPDEGCMNGLGYWDTYTNNIHCWDVWHTLGGKYSMYIHTCLYTLI